MCVLLVYISNQQLREMVIRQNNWVLFDTDSIFKPSSNTKHAIDQNRIQRL